jgi:hypothetical protein
MRAEAMTDAATPPAGPGTGTTPPRANTDAGARRRRVPSPKVTVVAAIAGFLVVFELLAYQLRSGHDPAIGAGPLTAQVRSGSAATGPSASGSSTGLVTRASGGQTTASPATQAPGAARSARHPSHSIATRASGGGRAGSSVASGEDAREQQERF